VDEFDTGVLGLEFERAIDALRAALAQPSKQAWADIPSSTLGGTPTNSQRPTHMRETLRPFGRGKDGKPTPRWRSRSKAVQSAGHPALRIQ
jgi:hypothetical protein